MAHINNETITLHTIVERTDELIDTLTELWEASVRATHDFVPEEILFEMRECLPNTFTYIHHLIVAKNEENIPVAFLGAEDEFLEMLFVRPEYIGKGIGRKLMEYAIDNLGIEILTVNEQNPNAVGFYEHLGFKAFRRTERDGEGYPFPLIYMRYSGGIL